MSQQQQSPGINASATTTTTTATTTAPLVSTEPRYSSELERAALHVEHPRAAGVDAYLADLRASFATVDTLQKRETPYDPNELRSRIDPGYIQHPHQTHKLTGAWRAAPSDSAWNATSLMVRLVQRQIDARNERPESAMYGRMAVKPGPMPSVATHIRSDLDAPLLPRRGLQRPNDAPKSGTSFDYVLPRAEVIGAGSCDLAYTRPLAEAPAKGGWYLNAEGQPTFAQARHYQRRWRHLSGSSEHPFFPPPKSMPWQPLS